MREPTFYKFQLYIEHIKISHSQKLRAPKTAGPVAAMPLAPSSPSCGTVYIGEKAILIKITKSTAAV